jgi:lipopolysaccharide O-acetyltransferase
MSKSFLNLLQIYGVGGFLRLAVDVLYTKLFISRDARVVRRPTYIRGAKYICFGKNLTVGVAVRLDASANQSKDGISLIFGENVQLNDYVHIGAIKEVSIGNNVLIASKVFISDHGHGSYGLTGNNDSPYIPPASRQLEAKPVIIEDNVWLGEMVSILPGVRIGYGSVIGAGSVVTKNIPPQCIAVGNPAIVIKRYDEAAKTWVRV